MYLFEGESPPVGMGGTEGEGHADSVLSMELDAELDSTILRSGPEQKARVGPSTN